MEREEKRKILPILLIVVLLLLSLFAISRCSTKKDNPMTVHASQSNVDGIQKYDEDNEHIFFFEPAQDAVGDLIYELVSAKDSKQKKVDYFELVSEKSNEIKVHKNTPADLYTLTIRAHAEGDDEYKEGNKEIIYLYDIKKADNSYITEPEAIEGLIFNNKDQTLIKAGEVLFGKILYKLNDGEWLEELPTGLDAGLYTVYYKVEGDQNHQDIAEKSILAKIDNQKVAYQPRGKVNFGSLGDLLDYLKEEGEDVAGKTIPVSDKPIQYVEYTYDKNQHNNGYTPPEGISMVGIDKATNAGTYVAIYTPIKNYTWNDGTRTPVSVVLKIHKKELPIPEVVKDLVYNGEKQKVELSNFDPETMIVTGNVAKSVGTHKAVVVLKDPLNYCWSDGSWLDVVIEWKILPAPVKVPSVITEYTYKTNIFGIAVWQHVFADDFDVFDKDMMKIVSGSSERYAGDYHVRVALLDKENYTWDDEEGGSEDRYIPWTIHRKSVGDKPQSPVVVTYNGRQQDNGYSKPTYVDRTGEYRGTNVGEYKAYYTPRSNYCWSDGTYDTAEVVLIIEKAKASFIKVPEAIEDLVYNGQNQNLVTKGIANGGITMYKVGQGQYRDEIPTGLNAGTYTVSCYVKGDENHDDSDVYNVEVTIDKAHPVVTVLPQGVEVTYDGNPHQLIVAGEAEGGTFYYIFNGQRYEDVSQIVASESGTYEIECHVEGDDNHEDMYFGNVISEIKPVEEPQFIVKPEAIHSYYNGQPKALLTAGSTNDGTILYRKAKEGWSKEIPTAVDAGQYDVYFMIKGDPNHGDSREYHYKATISKAKLIVDAPDQQYTYNGQPQGLPISVTTADGSVAKVTYRVSGGSYSEEVPQFTDATLNALGKETTVKVDYIAEAANHETVKGSYTIQIKKADPVITPEISGVNVTYDGNSHKLVNDVEVEGGTILYKLRTVALYSKTVPTKKSAGEYTVYYKVEGDRNHNDLSGSVESVIANADIVYDANGLTVDYDGQPHGVEVTANTVDGSRYRIRYSLDGISYNLSKAPEFTDVNIIDGYYTVYFKITADNHNDVLDTYKVTINKVPASYTAPVPVDGLVYDGNQHKLITAGSTDDGTMLYSQNGVDYEAEIPEAVNAGEYVVYYFVVADENHKDSEVATVNCVIEKAEPEITKYPQSANAVVYDEQSHVLVSAGETPHGHFEYSLDGINYSTEPVSAVDAGKYIIYVRVIGDDNHKNRQLEPLTAEILKAEGVDYISRPEGYQGIYDGNSHLLAIGGQVDEKYGTIVYSVDNETWLDNSPAATNPGLYQVYYKIKGSENYKDSEVSMLYAAIEDAQFVVNAPDQYYTYDGNAHGSPISVTTADGKPATITYTVSGEEYSSAPQFTDVLCDASGNVIPRTVQYTVEGFGHIPVSGSYNVTIDKANPIVSINEVNVVYDGKNHEMVDIVISGGTIQYSENGRKYSDHIPTRKNADDYKFYYKVTGDTNYLDVVGTVNAIISKAHLSVDAPDQTYPYDGHRHGEPISAKTVDGSSPRIRYGTVPNMYVLTDAPKARNVKDSLKVYYRVTADNHETVTGTYQLTIEPVVPKYVAPIANEGIWAGLIAKDLIKEGSSSDGTMMYKVEHNGVETPYSKNVPQGSEAGVYIVTYYCDGDNNHVDSPAVTMDPIYIIDNADFDLKYYPEELKAGETLNIEIIADGDYNFSCESSSPYVSVSVSNNVLTIVTAKDAPSSSAIITVAVDDPRYFATTISFERNIIPSNENLSAPVVLEDMVPVVDNLDINHGDNDGNNVEENYIPDQNNNDNDKENDDIVDPDNQDDNSNTEIIELIDHAAKITNIDIVSQRNNKGNDVNFFFEDDKEIYTDGNVEAGTYVIEANVTITITVDSSGKQTVIVTSNENKAVAKPQQPVEEEDEDDTPNNPVDIPPALAPENNDGVSEEEDNDQEVTEDPNSEVFYEHKDDEISEGEGGE